MRDLTLGALVVVMLILAVMCNTQAKSDGKMHGEDLGEVVKGRLYRFETPSAVCFVYRESILNSMGFQGAPSLSCIPNK